MRKSCGIKALPGLRLFKALTAGRGGFETWIMLW